MKTLPWLSVGLFVSACSVYDLSLLGADSSDGSGPGVGGSTESGGSANTGGKASGGGSMSSGGSGGTADNTGGAGGNVDSGVGGTGGSATGLIKLDDFEAEDGTAYANPPFYGQWNRWSEPPGDKWTIGTLDGPMPMGMNQAREDSGIALRVQGSGFTNWGVDTSVTLKEAGAIPAAVDFSSYKKLIFWARSEHATQLKVSLEDAFSHYDEARCGEDAVSPDPNCNKHCAVVPSPSVTTSWKKFEVLLSSVATAAGRTEDFDPEQVYAIHFGMSHLEGEVDFWIDDIYLEE